MGFDYFGFPVPDSQRRDWPQGVAVGVGGAGVDGAEAAAVIAV